MVRERVHLEFDFGCSLQNQSEEAYVQRILKWSVNCIQTIVSIKRKAFEFWWPDQVRHKMPHLHGRYQLHMHTNMDEAEMCLLPHVKGP